MTSSLAPAKREEEAKSCSPSAAHLKRAVFLFQEEMNRGKPNWEHLSEDLHVLITVEDTHNRAKIKLQRAINEVKKLLVPAVSIALKPPWVSNIMVEVCDTMRAHCVGMHGGKGGGRASSVQKVCVCVCVAFFVFSCVSL